MNLREDDIVSAVALVMEEEADTSAVAGDAGEELKPIDELPAATSRPLVTNRLTATSHWTATSPPRSRATRLARLRSPGKGGGPNLIHIHDGTLEVSGR